MSWKEKPHWLKFGLISTVLCFIISYVSTFIYLNYFFPVTSKINPLSIGVIIYSFFPSILAFTVIYLTALGVALGYGEPSHPFLGILIFFISILMSFPINFIIGAIIGRKIDKKKGDTEKKYFWITIISLILLIVILLIIGFMLMFINKPSYNEDNPTQKIAWSENFASASTWMGGNSEIISISPGEYGARITGSSKSNGQLFKNITIPDNLLAEMEFYIKNEKNSTKDTLIVSFGEEILYLDLLDKAYDTKSSGKITVGDLKGRTDQLVFTVKHEGNIEPSVIITNITIYYSEYD